MKNYTVKLVLRDHVKNENGLSAIYVRITIDRQTSYISTSKYTNLTNWNEKTESVRNDKETSRLISFKKNEIIQKIIQLQVNGKDISAKGIKGMFQGKDLTNIYDFIDEFAKEVKHKRSDETIEVYMKHKRNLLLFHPAPLYFENINTTFLAKYEAWIREEGGQGNYVHAIWKTLKTFFNAAKKKKLIDVYPFDEYENPVYVDPDKDYLSLSDLKKLEDFADEEKDVTLKQSAIYFLLGCYSGLRISDWKKFDIATNVEDNKIKLRAKKNGEWLTIPFSGPWARNLERMKQQPLTIEEPTLNEKIKIIAKKTGINKQLSSHCARKTFAVTLCADRGISLEVCATLMAITVEICFKNYYRVTDYKIKTEVLKAWAEL